MFPNPQDALPLPRNPNFEQYRKLAKELIRAAKMGEDAIRDWATRWVATLVLQSGIVIDRGKPVRIDSWSKRVAEYATKELVGTKTPTLTRAQFVIARSQGFASWPKLSRHLQRAQSQSRISLFEAAADAIVDGEATMLERLLYGQRRGFCRAGQQTTPRPQPNR